MSTANDSKQYNFPVSPYYCCGDKSGEGDWVKIDNGWFYLCPKCQENHNTN